MNTHDKNSNDDRSLNAELNQLEQQYRSAESIEPPELLDQAILNKARLEVERKNSWLDFGWIHGVTTIALVVMTFSIITIQKETGEFEPTIGKPTDRLRDQATAPMSGRVEQADKSVADEFSPVEKDDAGIAVQPGVAETSTTNRPATAAANVAASPTPTERAEANKEEKVTDFRLQDQNDISMQEHEASGTAPAPTPAPASASAPAPAPASTSTSAATSAATAKRLSEQQFAEPEMQADSTSAKNATTDRLSTEEDSKQRSKKGDADAPTVSDLLRGLERPDSSKPDGKQQQLLDQILALKYAGDDRWIEQLAEFKKLYPGVALPEELQNQE